MRALLDVTICGHDHFHTDFVYFGVRLNLLALHAELMLVRKSCMGRMHPLDRKWRYTHRISGGIGTPNHHIRLYDECMQAPSKSDEYDAVVYPIYKIGLVWNSNNAKL